MRSIILNSGPMHKYSPIGQDGVLVWKSAEAFRNALAGERQLGETVTRFLAIPKASQGGEYLDWFIPFDSAIGRDYEIIRWSSATIEEKKQALEKLESMSKKLLNYGLDLKAMALTSNDKLFTHFINGTKENEILPALHFPDNDCLFIVDGQPVITFWGFTKNRLSLKGAPFEALHNELYPKNNFMGSQAQTAKASTVVAPSFFKRHLWCLLIPLLLLLLLLLLWLLWRYLYPQGINLGSINIPPYEQVVSENKDNAQKTAINLKELLSKEDLNNLEIIKNPDGTYLVKDGLGRIYTVDDKVITDLADGNLANLVKGKAEDAVFADNPNDDVVDTQVGDKTQDLAVDDNVKDASVSDNAEDLTVADNTVVDANAPLEANSQVTPPQEANSQVTPPLLSEDGTTAKKDPFANTKPLNLSESDIAKGAVNNLAGTWRVKSSIVNSSTNKPVNLQYSFDKNGKGRAVIEEQNGVKCYSDVQGKIVDGHLQIDNESTAVCSDKSTYQMPKIKCKAGTNNDSSCEAIYSQGPKGEDKFNIELRQ